MKFNSVLFDLDGTLLDTADDLGAALNHVLTKHGKTTVSADLYTPEASNGSKALLKLGFGEDFNDFDFETLKTEFLDYYASHIAVHTRFFDEADTTLNYLTEHNIPWGVVTNKPAYLTVPLLRHFAEFAQCSTVVSGDTLSVAKPSPEPLLHALKAINMPANCCLYVGDALRDIQAGQNAQMKTAVAMFGYINADDDVDSWGADYQFQSLRRLIGLV